MSMQESLAAAWECLGAAEEGRMQAGEAMNTVEKIGGEGEVIAWEWKEIVITIMLRGSILNLHCCHNGRWDCASA